VGIGLLSLLGLGLLAEHAWMAAASVGMVAFMLAVATRPGISLAVTSFAYRVIGRAPRLFGRIRGAIRDTAGLFAPRMFLLTTALAVLGWLAEGLAFALILDALGAEVSPFAAVIVFSVAMIVGSLTLLPGGLGGTEATMLLLLTTTLDVPLDLAVAATAVIRVTTLWFAVAIGFLALPVAMRRARRAGEATETEGAPA
jgi:uncharacterized protein (TIRG00374 family)